MGQAADPGRLVCSTPAPRSTRLRYALGYPFLYRSLRKRLGLQRCRFAGSGAAPIAPELLQWFYGLGGHPRDLRHDREQRRGHRQPSRPDQGRHRRQAHPGVELRLDPVTGEMTRPPRCVRRLLGQARADRRVLGADGWLRTGDVGEWVDGTHLKIVDRLKDILITGGKNVSRPRSRTRSSSPPMSAEAVMVGGAFLTALISIELDWWRCSCCCPHPAPAAATLLDQGAGPRRGGGRLHRRLVAIEPRRSGSSPRPTTDGELTATQKVKRAAITGAFGDLIEGMYREAASGGVLSSTVRGLAQGSLYHLLGLGFVIVYRGTGVVNFLGRLMILGAYWTSYFALVVGLGFWPAGRGRPGDRHDRGGGRTHRPAAHGRGAGVLVPWSPSGCSSSSRWSPATSSGWSCARSATRGG